MSWREGLMALLLLSAALFLWKLQNQEEPLTDATNTSNEQLPGFYLNDAELVRYNTQGVPQYTITAEKILQDPNTDELTLENINVIYHENNNWSIKADSAVLPASRELISFKGNVIAAQQATRFQSESLTYNVNAQELSTDARITAKQGKQTMSAVGMLIDLKNERVQLRSQVKIRINP